MKRWSPIGLCALLAAACTEPQVPAAPDRLQTTPNAALNAALNTATSADSLEIIVSYDRQRTTRTP
jgi:hypothetical protein